MRQQRRPSTRAGQTKEEEGEDARQTEGASATKETADLWVELADDVVRLCRQARDEAGVLHCQRLVKRGLDGNAWGRRGKGWG